MNEQIVLKEKIDSLRDWLISTKLKSYDPCDFLCNDIIYEIERIKRVYGKYIPFGNFLSRYSVYSFENKYPVLFRKFMRKKKSVVSSALFIDGSLNMFDVTLDAKYFIWVADEMEWIYNNRCKSYAGVSWGLPFDWRMGYNIITQEGILAPKGTPYSTLSIYPVDAAMHFNKVYVPVYSKYIDMARSSKYLFTEYLKKRTISSDSVSLSYSPLDDYYIVNVNSYAAATLYTIGECITFADKLIQYVLNEQREDGSWNYWGSQEKDRSISIDSLHQIYIMQNLYRCYIKDREYNMLFEGNTRDDILESIRNGVNFYLNNFIDNGRICKFRLSEKGTYNEEYELIDIVEALSFFMDISDEFPECINIVDMLYNSIIKNYTYSDRPYLKTKLSPNCGVDIPFTRWGQAQAFYVLTKYYKRFYGK